MTSVDPDSTQGKVILLIIDKVFIGALLAVAFIGYDTWKRDELRSYNEEVVYEFKRAEFTEKLLPIVLDKEQTASIRIEVLRKLIRTRSIDEQSAFHLALSLLKEGKLSLPQGEDVDYQRIQQFVRMLEPIAPNALSDIVSAVGHYPKPDDAPIGYTEALVSLFAYAWQNGSEQDLSALNDKNFVAAHWESLQVLTPNIDVYVERWRDSPLMAIQIIRDMHILSLSRRSNRTTQQASLNILKHLSPEQQNTRSANLSQALFSNLTFEGLLEDIFVEAAFQVMEQNVGRLQSSENNDFPSNTGPYFEQSFAAHDYIIWASQYSRTSERLAIPIARDLLNVTNSQNLEPTRVDIYHAAICALVGSMTKTASEQARTPEADQLLKQLALQLETGTWPPEISVMANWENAGGLELARQYCGLSQTN